MTNRLDIDGWRSLGDEFNSLESRCRKVLDSLAKECDDLVIEILNNRDEGGLYAFMQKQTNAIGNSISGYSRQLAEKPFNHNSFRERVQEFEKQIDAIRNYLTILKAKAKKA